MHPWSGQQWTWSGPFRRQTAATVTFWWLWTIGTGFPFMVLLKTTGSEQVATALMSIFSMVASLTKSWLTEAVISQVSSCSTLNNMLGIRAIRTSPYHPRTDGMVERIYSTTKQWNRGNPVWARSWAGTGMKEWTRCSFPEHDTRIY